VKKRRCRFRFRLALKGELAPPKLREGFPRMQRKQEMAAANHATDRQAED